jgi:uncharacterized protein YbaR (Trm112 family)
MYRNIIDKLQCPQCRERLEVSRTEIEEEEIIEGALCCGNGYEWLIPDGVLEIVGFANLSQLEYPTSIGLPYGISIVAAMTPSIVRGISHGVTLEYYAEYNSLNSRLHDLENIGCRILEDLGYRALGKLLQHILKTVYIELHCLTRLLQPEQGWDGSGKAH